MSNDKIDLSRPVRHRATKKPVTARPMVAVDGMGKSTLAMYPEDFETNYENVPLPPPRRVRIGTLEFYKHCSNFHGGPLVYVSKVPFGLGDRAPVRIAKLYGTALRDLRDWCNAMLGEG